MRKENLYKRLVRSVWCFFALSALLCGCLYEHPELTSDGENGIDPTSVTLNANLLLHLNMPALRSEGTSMGNPVLNSDISKYRSRFIIEAYIDRAFVSRRVVYQDVMADASGEVLIPVSMRLHARNYEIAVWADYVPLSEDGTITDDYFYNTSSGHLVSVYNSNTYYGNNEFKDVFCGSTAVDLEDYRDEWGARKNVDIELKRPVARLQLTANDVASFLNLRGQDGKNVSFVARLSYEDYLNMGYNVLERLPRHGLLYEKCKRTFTTGQLVAGEPFALIFDYVFAPDEGNVSIPVKLDILDKDEANVLASTSFNVFCRAGYHTDITYGFLTADPNGGIAFDPSFSGEGEIDVPGKPQNK